jgi:membrane protein YqaA with SNARE-associated domain
MTMGIFENAKKIVSSRASLAVSFVWGLLEATAFFIVPDVFLGFVALMAPVGVLAHCGASIAGAMIGGSVMYVLARVDPAAVNRFLEKIPGISAHMISGVHADLAQHGIFAMLYAPWKGIPYKIFAAQAGILHLDFISFVFVSAPARLERFFVVCAAAAALGVICKTHIRTHTRGWMFGYILFWALTYILYAFILRIRS